MPDTQAPAPTANGANKQNNGSGRLYTTTPFISRTYQILRELGAGAYGIVCAARNIYTGEEVAIKKVTKVFDKTILAKRALREIKLLKHFNGHENITSIIDMDVADLNDFNEIFLVEELMEADLHQIIRSEQPLTDAHFQYFIYQILHGLKYIHSANVLHRDLKPGNLLVNADCELKICDFGLARGFSEAPEGNAGFMTEYVATRWYRAPEIMLSFQCYTKAIDMWSVGCIFAELLGGKPLFKGRDYVDQLNQILGILGTPGEETLRRIGSQRAQVYIRSLTRSRKIPFEQLFPRATPMAIDLLEKLLKFDPAARINVTEALAHPYLANYHEEAEEPSHPELFDFSFETLKELDDIKGMISQEVLSWREHRAQQQQNRVRPRQDLQSPDIEQAQNIPRGGEEREAADTYQQSSMDVDNLLERELAGSIAPDAPQQFAAPA